MCKLLQTQLPLEELFPMGKAAVSFALHVIDETFSEALLMFQSTVSRRVRSQSWGGEQGYEEMWKNLFYE